MDGVPQRVIEELSQLLVPGGSRPGYATAAVARETERQSRNAVVRFLGAALPDAKIIEMATNNPGFDLETSVDRFRFVEVKGTSKPLPTFFLSEGERRFGDEHADAYLLAVVYGMDLSGETFDDIALSRGATQAGRPTRSDAMVRATSRLSIPRFDLTAAGLTSGLLDVAITWRREGAPLARVRDVQALERTSLPKTSRSL
jgi:hypothetical protein